MKLVVGLGNPGKTYERTRHNIGWRVLDALKLDFRLDKKFNAAVAKEGEVLFCKPETFMNLSGQAVRAIADYYHIEHNDITVVYDDKDLPFGTIRVRSEGSAGGHNGVQSLIDILGDTSFGRIRIGIAPEHPIADAAQFVLARFSTQEEQLIPKIIKGAHTVIHNAIAEGIHTKTHRDIHIE